MGKTLGEYLKHLRYNHPDRPSIREVARRAKIDVSYLSRMEKDEVSPPSEEILQRLASVLDVEDPDELLWLANKVPPEFRGVIKERFSEIPSFLRTVKDLPEEEWNRLVRYVNRTLVSKKDMK